ncbi:MAG TPA: hypothetical protein PKB06_11680, partial [Actinotalea sp.]|nr:hypothetical protein [Actinotalea sp.]
GEQARVLAPALAGRVLAGFGLTSLVASPLVRALDDGTVALPVALRLDAAALTSWLSVLLVALAAVVGSVAHDTSRRARTASPREAVR